MWSVSANQCLGFAYVQKMYDFYLVPSIQPRSLRFSLSMLQLKSKLCHWFIFCTYANIRHFIGRKGSGFETGWNLYNIFIFTYWKKRNYFKTKYILVCVPTYLYCLFLSCPMGNDLFTVSKM